MADIHLPQLEEPEESSKGKHDGTKAKAAGGTHRPHLLRLVLEVLLISMGVFLGLAGEQWRESAHQRELAQDALRRFRKELSANRDAVAGVKDYHVKLKRALDEFLSTDRAHRKALSSEFHGLNPAGFQRTAWDLAVATQALTHLDSDLTYSLTRVYNLQQRYEELTRGVLQAMYVHPPIGDIEPFLASVQIYYGDIVLEEPALLKQYDELLPRIDRTLGEKPAGKR